MTENCTPEARPPSRIIEGWEERFLGNEPRLSEVAELYRDIGFEVLIEEYQPQVDCAGCKECFEGSVVPVMALYVRKTEEAKDLTDEDLY